MTFEPGLGAPDEIEFDQLQSLSEFNEPGVKYFSGMATYETSFTLPPIENERDQFYLDLGQVSDLAEVSLNGRVAGTAWKAPYRVEVTGLIRNGSNDLRIRVANRWVNRLVGDQQQGQKRITVTAIPTYVANAPLLPAGLIGPVSILTKPDTDTVPRPGS